RPELLGSYVVGNPIDRGPDSRFRLELKDKVLLVFGVCEVKRRLVIDLDLGPFQIRLGLPEDRHDFFIERKCCFSWFLLSSACRLEPLLSPSQGAINDTCKSSHGIFPDVSSGNASPASSTVTLA